MAGIWSRFPATAALRFSNRIRIHSRQEQVPSYPADNYPAGTGVIRLDAQTYSDIARELRTAAGLK
jgi:hypothetical protein